MLQFLVMGLARELSDSRLEDDDQALDLDRLLVVEFVVGATVSRSLFFLFAGCFLCWKNPR